MIFLRNGKSKFANMIGIFLLFLIAESWIPFSSGQSEMKFNLSVILMQQTCIRQWSPKIRNCSCKIKLRG